MDQISVIKTRKVFLLKCRREGICPKFINHKCKVFDSLLKQNHPYKELINKNITNFKRGFLNMEISVVCWAERTLEGKEDRIKSSIWRKIENGSYNKYIKTQEEKCHRNIIRNRERLKHKLSKLRLENEKMEPDIWYDKKCLVHLTDQVIPPEVETLLSFGPKFAVQEKSSQIPYLNVLADCEQIIKHQEFSIRDKEEEYNGDKTRADITEIISDHIKRNNNTTKVNKIDKFLMSALNKTREFKKENKEIVITNSDKGDNTVLMWEDEYNTKMKELLSDSTTYKVIGGDPTIKLQRKNNRITNCSDGIY